MSGFSSSQVGVALRVVGVAVDVGRSGGRRRVLHDVSVDFSAGEFVAVIGPNGSGKSTLLRALAGLVPHAGVVHTGAGGCPGPCDIALMPQSAQLPEGMSVAEYVLLGRTPYVRFFERHSFRDHAVVADVVERLGLGGLAGRSVRELSGGEAQRVMLARVLAQQAPVIVLDEPTSSLDIGTARDVLDFVDEHRRGEEVTVVAAIHDLTVAARYADRVVLLDQGRVRAVGAPAEVLCADVLSQVYRSPLLVHRIGEQFVVLPA